MIATSLKQARYEAFIGHGLEGFQKRSVVELQPSGVAELDAVLGGGFPRGSLVELCGAASSGRTSLAFSLLAQATERQEACAFVDVSDSLDPLSLAAAGVELRRLLWIRCGESGDGEPDLKASAYFAPPEKEVTKTQGIGSASKKPIQLHDWRHPRELMRGVEKAIPSIVGKQTLVTESAQINVVSRCAGEQVEALTKLHVKRACDLSRLRDGQYTRVAGCVIARQPPGTAKGFVFLSLEDETGISNVIVNPDLYERYRVVINREKFLRVDGILQNQDHTIFIKASRVLPISISAAETQSHDYH